MTIDNSFSRVLQLYHVFWTMQGLYYIYTWYTKTVDLILMILPMFVFTLSCNFPYNTFSDVHNQTSRILLVDLIYMIRLWMLA